MSRHRAVRNLDLDEELAIDDDYDDDPYGEQQRKHRRDICYPRLIIAAVPFAHLRRGSRTRRQRIIRHSLRDDTRRARTAR